MNLSEYIKMDPTKRFGRPLLRGTRITVYDVLNWLANDMSKEEIMKEFPELTAEHIKASLLFASNRERVFIYTG